MVYNKYIKVGKKPYGKYDSVVRYRYTNFNLQQLENQSSDPVFRNSLICQKRK